MICAGYVFLDLPKSKGGAAAEEGTACGEYLEWLLTNKTPSSHASNGVFINSDMMFYTQPIADDCKARAATEILCEQRIDWTTRSGVVIRGQYDICFVDHEGTLCIEDLKYGWGIVEVKENWQLLGYAIGEVIRRDKPFEKISFKIHQPRPHHEEGTTREWILTYSELLGYKERIEKRMEDIINGNRTLTTSSKCKYCQGAGEACPAFNRLFYRSMEITTEFVQDSITDDELSRQLDQVKRAKEVIKIKEDSLTELGVNRIKEGKLIPNYSQTERYGNRTWKKGVSPESIHALTGKSALQTTMMTPAKVEKMGIPRKLVSQLAEKQFLGMKLEKKNSTEIGNNIFGTTNPEGGK